MPPTNNGASGNESTAINPDKAIARLLYAMLKQKSLKDIDWNQVACDPALLESISNGHAARMRYARFRTSVDNQVQKKEAAAKNEGKDEETKEIKPSLSRSASKSKPKEPKEPKEHKEKEYKPRQAKTVVKRLRDDSSDFSFSDIKDVKKQDPDEKEKEKENKSFLDPDLFSDNNFTETLEFKPKPKQESRVLETKTNEKAMEDLLANASFNSSLPSPPTEAVQSMESIERKKKIRKMYAFSPTMKAGTLHQIPLPRGAVPPSSRIHSLPTLSTTAGSSSNTPVNLSGVLMMRHHSAGSMTEQLQQQQQQQQMLRQTRMMTPSSDTDLHQNTHHNHQQFFAHHTQIPLMTDPAVVGGFDPTFDFNTGAASVGGSTTGHPSPWMATPFSSPPMPTFDMSPYTTTLDMMGGAAAGNAADADGQSLPGLFQMEFDSQQQQNEALQASIMALAFTKNSGWDVMLGQASNGNQNHSI